MKIKDVAMYVLGAIITVCFFVIIGLLIFTPMPTENSEVLYLAIGALIGFAGSVVNWFYGSSKGSSEKNEILAVGARKNDPPLPPNPPITPPIKP